MFPCRRDKKGGRAKKPKRGRKADSRPSSMRQRTPTKPLHKIPSLRFKKFSDKFSFPENMKRDLFARFAFKSWIKPVETTCQHYFCVECLKGLINSGQRGTYAVCKEKVGPVKIPTRMVLE